jgi:tripartite-type tricarboxylate transporter receptor subunit TctC
MLSATGLRPALAQTWPQKPIRMVIPFPPGGPTDIVGRLIGQQMSDAFGQTVLIDNRAGASGTIGADLVAKAAPDGYTLMVNVSVHVINPSLYAKLPHDAIKDFTPITSLAYTPTQLLVPADSQIRTVQDLVTLVKSQPGKHSFASSSVGAPGHLAGELFKRAAGIDATHAPYKGSSPALTDLIGGQVTYMFDSMPSSIALVKGGKLRALAVTSPARSASLPNVPTMAEAGFPSVTITSWYGLWGPAGMPAPVVQRIYAEVARELALPAVRTRLSDASAEGMGDPPDKFAAFCIAEAERYAQLVKAANIRIE